MEASWEVRKKYERNPLAGLPHFLTSDRVMGDLTLLRVAAVYCSISGLQF
jgi:hypothetical protein